MQCRKCPLWRTRTNIVQPRGSPDPRVLFIGEAPGREEDEQGKPFVGRSGKLLDQWIAKMGIDNYAIANICWCRPPNNRNPTPQETRICTKNHLLPYLRSIKPCAVIPLGKTATEFMFGFTVSSMAYWVGQIHRNNNITIIPMYHPAFILRTHQQVDHLLKIIGELITPSTQHP